MNFDSILAILLLFLVMFAEPLIGEKRMEKRIEYVTVPPCEDCTKRLECEPEYSSNDAPVVVHYQVKAERWDLE